MQIKTSPCHRKCKHPSCKSILSIYNNESYCHVHLSAAHTETREKKVKADLAAKA